MRTKQAVGLCVLGALLLLWPAGQALADDAGTIDHGTLGVADTSRVDNVLQITMNEYDDGAQCWGPREPWRPDGAKVVYQCQIIEGGLEPNFYNEICVMNPDGTGQDRLTNNGRCDSHPSFTPDGQKIVFQRNVEDGTDQGNHGEIFIMNANGSGQTNLTQAHGGPVNGTGDDGGYTFSTCENKPQVSPDGTMIAFHACTTDGDDEGEIWVMNIDGSNPRKVSGDLVYCTHHYWSPCSNQLVFAAKTDTDGYKKIYRTGPNGGPVKLSTTGDGICENWPVYDPTGTKIVFHRMDDRGSDPIHSMVLINADWSDERVLASETANSGSEWDSVCSNYSWNSTGEWIAFKRRNWSNTGDSFVYSSIFIINAATEEEHQLTQDYSDFRCWWSPDNTKILFRDWEYEEYHTRDGNLYSNDLLVLNLDSAYFPQTSRVPGVCQELPIPTLSQWGVIGLALLIFAAGAVTIRRRQTTEI